MKFTFHVPTQQYGFLEIEGDKDDLPEMEHYYNQYAETPVAFKNGTRKLLKAWVGGEVYYDELAHEYTNELGEVYLSGSKYAELDETPFDSVAMSSKVAESTGMPQTDVARMWKMKADISNGFGTAIHEALELYGTYRKHADTGKEYHNHDNPTIQHIVESFFADRDEDDAYELLVVDHDRKYAGRIDRVVKENGGYWVDDFKTNAKMDKKKLAKYQKQLSFYASIMEAGGKRCLGLRIHHWDGKKWVTTEMEKLKV